MTTKSDVKVGHYVVATPQGYSGGSGHVHLIVYGPADSITDKSVMLEAPNEYRRGQRIDMKTILAAFPTRAEAVKAVQDAEAYYIANMAEADRLQGEADRLRSEWSVASDAARVAKGGLMAAARAIVKGPGQ